jgi:glutamate/tyrosine decarboxylase-like PLP-dependent enzyme
MNVRKELKFDSIVNTRYNPGPEMAQFTDECSPLASMIPAVFNALI